MISFPIKPSKKQKTHSFNSFVKPIVVRFILYCTVNVDLTEFSHCQRHTVWKLQKYTLIEKKFRQINYLVISVMKKILSRNFCQKRVRVNFCTFHTVPQIISSVKNQHLPFHEKFVKVIRSPSK